MRQILLLSGRNQPILTAFNGKFRRLSPAGPLAALMRLLDRSKQRDDLSELTDDQLADIGLTRREAEREAGKWFWE